jgi:hypothetical protein
MMWVFLYPQESEGRTWFISLPGCPGNVYLATTAAFNRPGKVSLAQQQHHQKKKSFIF